MCSRWYVAGGFGAVALYLLLSQGCNSQPGGDPWGSNGPDAKPRVLASFAPLYCFAAHVAGERAEVRCLLTGSGPHEYEPTPGDIRLLSGADVLFTNGLGLEEFIEDMIASAGNRRLKIVRTGEASALSKRLLMSDGTPCPHGHIHRGTDPHIWLGLDEARVQVQVIRDTLAEIDPAGKETYHKNAGAFLKQLDDLKQRGEELPKLSGSLITFHDSFKYFTRSFGMKSFPKTIRGMSGQEIAGQQLQKLAADFRDRPGKIVIASEPQYPKRVAETLAKEIGRDRARIVEIDPLETAPTTGDHRVDKDYYVKAMRQNVDTLLGAMK